MLKRNLALCTVTILASCFCGCASTTEIFKDKNVKVTETLHSYIPYSAHAGISDIISITVFGKAYKNVRGYIPFYLSIPEINSILFVTGREYDYGQATVHMVNLKTKKEKHFPAYDSNIGSNIRQTNNWCYERVESLNDDKLVICAGNNINQYHYQFHYYIDLKNAKFKKEAGEVWNSSDGTTNYYVYIGGKRPKD